MATAISPFPLSATKRPRIFGSGRLTEPYKLDMSVSSPMKDGKIYIIYIYIINIYNYDNCDNVLPIYIYNLKHKRRVPKDSCSNSKKANKC